VRVAAAISWPERLKPRASAGVGPIAYIDILPTIAGLAEAKLSGPVDGKDVSMSLLSGKRLPDRTLFLGEDYSKPSITGERGPTDPEALRGRAGAVISGSWKLVGDQLFDLEADPVEEQDVAAQHPETVEKLKQEVTQFSALRKVPRNRMNAARLPSIPQWDIRSTPLQIE
jgi:arylsulfatase B